MEVRSSRRHLTPPAPILPRELVPSQYLTGSRAADVTRQMEYVRRDLRFELRIRAKTAMVRAG